MSARAAQHVWLTGLVGQVHEASRGTYGARRVHAELVLGRGVCVSHGTIEMLMRRAGLRGVVGRPRYRRVPNAPTAADQVERNFDRSEPNQLWVTDITEHRCREGKVYCAVVLDVFSRRVVGWAIDSNPTASLTTNALAMAIEQRSPATLSARDAHSRGSTRRGIRGMSPESRLRQTRGRSGCPPNPGRITPHSCYASVEPNGGLSAWPEVANESA